MIDTIKLILETLKTFQKYALLILLSLAISDSLLIHKVAFFNEIPKPNQLQLKSLEILFWVGFLVVLVTLVGSYFYNLAETRKANRKFSVTFPISHSHLWHQAIQPDKTVLTQISATFQIKNRTADFLGLTTVRLIKPQLKGEVLNNQIFIKNPLNKISGTLTTSNYEIPPKTSMQCSFVLMIKGTLDLQIGELVKSKLAISDDDGQEEIIEMDFKVS